MSPQKHNELLTGHAIQRRSSSTRSCPSGLLVEALVTQAGTDQEHTKHAERSVDAAVGGFSLDRAWRWTAIAAASAARSSAACPGKGEVLWRPPKAAKSIQWWLPGRQKRADRAAGGGGLGRSHHLDDSAGRVGARHEHADGRGHDARRRREQLSRPSRIYCGAARGGASPRRGNSGGGAGRAGGRFHVSCPFASQRRRDDSIPRRPKRLSDNNLE